ncbi:type II CAAX endopeptidase family protein [Aureivirga marina]|uniref:type II CAAX endopeptidase family protein n=1 Tax=Aureivirga marina TaxID=1182451 RepID=UPI0018CAFFA5|nr:type II CAAX endopeptidase family protein [Aureivirga marina]
MKRILVIFILVFTQFQSFSQDFDASLLLNKINYSNSAQFQYYLKKYDQYLEENTNDLMVFIERCKFLENYLEQKDISKEKRLQLEDALEKYQKKLYREFPNHPKTAIYKLEHSPKEKHKEILQKAEHSIVSNSHFWNEKDKSFIYEQLGHYHLSKNNSLAIKYALQAKKHEPEKDYSDLIANAYRLNGDIEKAAAILEQNLHLSKDIHSLSKKANLLFEIGKLDIASKTYKQILARDSTYVLNEHLAALFEKNHEYKLARKFLVKDTVGSWKKLAHLQKLVAFDIKYSDPKITLETYRRLQELNPKDDFFGIKRFDIFLKDPTSSWKWSEIFHFLIFIGFITCLLIIPFIWILPIIGLEVVLKNNNFKIVTKTPFDWSIRYFWYVSFCYLLTTSLVIFIFEYQDFIAVYLKVGEIETFAKEATSTLSQAHQMLFFVFLMFITTLFTLNKKRLEYYYNSTFSIYNIVLFGFIFVIFNSLLLKGLDYLFHVEEIVNISYFSAAKEEVAAVLKEYGFSVAFLLVAIIVPIYEETIFRGIILGSVEQHIGFRFANIFQAILFGLVHGSVKLFIFYFIFGFILGIVAKRSKGLLTNIVFHGINNMVVLYSLTNL